MLGTLLGNISYIVTESDKAADLFYTYSNVGNGGLEYDAGINIGGRIGVHGFISTPGEIGVGVQLTPWVHGSASIGLSGIGVTIGINTGNTAHAVSANIGWGTVLVVGMAVTPAPGARAAAATTAVVLLIAGFVQYGDGGHYF